jgi:hypothetical protein
VEGIVHFLIALFEHFLVASLTEMIRLDSGSLANSFALWLYIALLLLKRPWFSRELDSLTGLRD